MKQASFTIKKTTFLKELKTISKALGKKSKYNLGTVLELTITDNLLTLVIPGIKLQVPCTTNSTAKASLGFYYFIDIIESSAFKVIECQFHDNEMKIGTTSFKVQTTFFETDSILRSIKLPINYTDYHVLQLEYKGYTLEELQFNQLEFKLHHAKKSLQYNLEKAHDILRYYGVNRTELKNLVEMKIKLGNVT